MTTCCRTTTEIPYIRVSGPASVLGHDEMILGVREVDWALADLVAKASNFLLLCQQEDITCMYPRIDFFPIVIQYRKRRTV